MNNQMKSNKLVNEKSPYLLQHAYNPINWYPWGNEAFEDAKKEDKPIFLSIGYSTCHWCHVMAHESFEDEEVASFINKYFIPIKVDREERPDVDSIYMTACQAMTGHGGWPLTIIMTYDQKPFFAGTYFPKNSRYNMPGLMDILKNVIDMWFMPETKKKLINSSNHILNQLKEHFYNDNTEQANGNISLSDTILDNCYNQLINMFDNKYGGFGNAPKFPTPHKLMFLLRYYLSNNDDKALDMVRKTLDSMYKGGIFDHIGFGFSRYSTDNKWLVPHFEKMLYDNALLIISYLEAYEVTKNNLYKDIAIKCIDYVFRNLYHENGGFYCAEDADSEGEEGKFYVFTPDEIKVLLGSEDGEYFNQYFNITDEGNFEGKSIPNLINNINLTDSKIDSMRSTLLEYRSNRYKLHKDDKILTSWNGLMLAALGKAYKITQDKIYLDYGKKTVNFIYDNLINSEGRLLARYRDNEAKHKAYLDDYAFLAYGLIELYESSLEVDLLKKAIDLNNKMIDLFHDDVNGGFYLYGEDSETLIARPKELYDGAIPSGNSVAAYNLIKLARITSDPKLEEIAYKTINYILNNIKSDELNYSFFLIAASFSLSNTRELVCVIKNTNDENKLKSLLSNINDFNLTVVMKNEKNKDVIEELLPFIKDYDFFEDKSTYYLCKGGSCLAPFNDLNKLKDILKLED